MLNPDIPVYSQPLETFCICHRSTLAFDIYRRLPPNVCVWLSQTRKERRSLHFGPPAVIKAVAAGVELYAPTHEQARTLPYLAYLLLGLKQTVNTLRSFAYTQGYF